MAGLTRDLVNAPDLPLKVALNEALSLIDLLRAAGYSSDILYFIMCSLTNHPGTVVRVMVKQGDCEYNADLGVVMETPQQVSTEWLELLKIHNNRTPAGSRYWVETVREQSAVRPRMVEVLFGLAKKGIRQDDLSSRNGFAS